jgi:ABC-type antimicrobial peptide transport system ATPase subunit
LLIDMVALALCGTICGANTWADIERFSLAHQEWFEWNNHRAIHLLHRLEQKNWASIDSRNFNQSAWAEGSSGG